MDKETIEKVRAAIKDRAVWFALLFVEFEKELGAEKAEALARRALWEFGRLKGRADGGKLSPEALMAKFEASGGAELFSAVITDKGDHLENRVGFCALAEAWKEMGLDAERLDLYCDIAMDGDRGRADFHGIPLELGETLAKGDEFCRICLKKQEEGS